MSIQFKTLVGDLLSNLFAGHGNGISQLLSGLGGYGATFGSYAHKGPDFGHVFDFPVFRPFGFDVPQWGRHHGNHGASGGAHGGDEKFDDGGCDEGCDTGEPDDITVSLIATFESGLGEGAAEIVAHDPESQRLFVTNAEDGSVDILDISDPANPAKIGSIDVSEIDGVGTGGPNSVAVGNGIVAVAVEADEVTDQGYVAFYDADGNYLGSVVAGSLPDMLTFTPDGTKVLVANEGEADGGVDPKGSVSIIDLSGGVAAATVTTVDFTAFDAYQTALEAAGLRIFDGGVLSDDVEPEYIAISEDGTTAFITLQEANAVAVLDIAAATITEIQPLGAKDHSVEGNGLDTSDRDDGINIDTAPVFGLYMPDAIASYDAGGATYYVTANEGDARDEDARVKDLVLDPTAFPDAADLQEDEDLGRLEVSTIDGDTDGDGDYDVLYAYGARSFTIWDADGTVIFDSGDMIEQTLADLTPDLFNANDGDPDEFDNRSDAKGPEPESVVIGEVDGRTYAFVGLERAGGGVMIFDITSPTDVCFVQYIRTEGDIAPEGLTFIAACDSPIDVPLLVVANEVSGTTSLYQINFEGVTLKGTARKNTLEGTAGDDVIDGKGGKDTIFGFAGNDILDGGNGRDTIHGGFGDDTIDGGKGKDRLFGEAGDDAINGGKGDDLVDGGTGDDTLSGDEGDDTLIGGEGDDLFDWAVGDGSDTIYGDAGEDTLRLYSSAAGQTIVLSAVLGVPGFTVESGGETVYVTGVEEVIVDFSAGAGTLILDGDFASSGIDVSTVTFEGSEDADVIDASAIASSSDASDVRIVAHGNGGNDTLTGGVGSDELFGDDGDDTLEGEDGDDTIHGGDGADILRGGAGNDTLHGGAGNDRIGGKDGNDTIYGDAGNDQLWGDAGNDTIDGGDGVDTIHGGTGDDTIWGGNEADYLYGDAGDDDIHGGGGSDHLFGGSGQDVIRSSNGDDDINGDAGNDELHGEGGNDTISGGSGADTVYGGIGNDAIEGGDGNDRLFGQDDDDTIAGGAGDDTIGGGSGDDRMTGGAGNDTIDGGDGVDTAVFSGNRSDYLVDLDNSIVVDLRGGFPDGVDRFENVEYLEFADETVSLAEETFTLQILHASDLEGGVDAIGRAANFAAIIDTLEDEYENTITLSAGDNFIPSPFYNASGDAATFNLLFEGFYNEAFGLIDTTALDPSADTNGDGFYDNTEVDTYIQANGLLASDVYTTDINGDGYLDYFEELDNFEGRADVTIMNIIGFDASALGNHEFDNGSDALENIVNYDSEEGNSLSGISVSSITAEFGSEAVNYLQEVDWVGALFPYLSANLDFSGDGDLGSLFTDEILPNTEFQSDLLSARDNPSDPSQTASDSNDAKIGEATIIEQGGELIGVIGATTQLLDSISSPTGTNVEGGPFTSNDMAQLAAILQPIIDDLIAGDPDSGREPVNKIILTSHLQQLALETELAGLLSGVDIIIAGGSDTLLADETDDLRAGDVAAGDYPVQTVDADGNPVLIVSTDGEYSYVGRLVVEFDADGHIITESLDEDVNGAYATTDEGVLAVTGEADVETAVANSEKATDVEAITDAVAGVVIETDSNVFGETDVFLDGVRTSVRTEETNLGDLTADANLAVAQSVDDTVLVSIKNGGGIRAAIGEVDYDGNETVVPANPLSGKEEGEISQLDIENSLRFNNGLTLVTVTAAQLLLVLEHAVAATEDGATPGQFAQVGGISFSFDQDQPAGSRVVNVALVDDEGNKTVVVENGEVVDTAPAAIRMVTLNFLADGGDNYPFDEFIAADPTFANRVDLEDLDLSVIEGELDGNADFAGFGSEQDALAEYLAANHPAADGPDGPNDFDQEETGPEGDTRIQNLNYREDTVLEGTETTIVINEVLGSTTSTDSEYVELYGTPGASLAGLSLIVVESDAGSANGTIDFQYDFADGAVIGDNGFFLLANGLAAATYGVTADVSIANNSIENSSYTIALVETASLSGSTVSGSETIVDAVGVTDGGASDSFWFDAPVVGPDGSFLPAGVGRVVDGVDTDTAADWKVLDFNNDPTVNTPTSGGTGSGGDLVAIYEIQGAEHRSPYEGQAVVTSGIVTAVTSGGYYLQDPSGDGDIATSDGIFVYGDTSVAVGDEVKVSGTVQEFQYPPALSVTEIVSPTTIVVSSGNALPDAVVLGVDRIQPDDVIDDDGLTSFDAEDDAIDFLESLEGMLAEVDNPLVVAGTNAYGEVGVVAGRGGESGSGDSNAIVSEGDFNPEILLTDDVIVTAPDAVTGDTFAGNLVGVMDYTFGYYKLQLTETPTAVSGGETPEVTTLAGDATQMTIATYNTLNLDPGDGDPGGAADKLDALAQSIVANLGSPDVIALQEILDSSGVTDNGVTSASLTLHELTEAVYLAGGPLYAFVSLDPANNADGGIPGGNIQNAYLYNPARVALDYSTLERIGDDAFEDGGDGTAAEADYAGTRKPLVAEFTFLSTGETVMVINNHLKSKSQDDGLYGENQPPEEVTLAQRVDQAGAINDYVEGLLAVDPDAKVVVLGDLNDFQFSDTLDTLADGGDGTAELVNLVDSLPTEDQYSYIYNGNSQMLDHILVSAAIEADAPQIDAVHINLDFGFPDDNASDHDPLVALIDMTDHMAVA